MEATNQKADRMERIQGLRAVAFFGIFLSHGFGGRAEGLGAWGVSIFLILSGFLMEVSYLKKDETPQVSGRFVWNKVKRLYPLHVAMTFACVLREVFISCIRHESIRIPKMCLDILFHILLIQDWIPSHDWYGTLNSVDWYLCVCVLCYLVFPLILTGTKRYRNNGTAIGWMGVLLVMQLLIALFAKSG